MADPRILTMGMSSWNAVLRAFAKTRPLPEIVLLRMQHPDAGIELPGAPLPMRCRNG